MHGVVELLFVVEVLLLDYLKGIELNPLLFLTHRWILLDQVDLSIGPTSDDLDYLEVI